MKRISKMYFFLLIFTFFFPIFAERNPDEFSVIRKVTDGTLNFTSFELVITGNGIPEMNVTNLNSARITAEKAAVLNAKQKTAKALLSLILSKKTTVKAFFEAKGMKDFVEKLIDSDDFKDVLYERFYSNSSVDVTYKVNVSGYLQKITDAAANDVPKQETPTEEKNEDISEKTKSILVVTLKNKFEPALMISLVNEKGEKIYDKSTGKSKSPTAFFFAKKKAKNLIEKADLSGETLSVQALKIKNGTEIVLRNSDAEKIRKELKKECLEEGKVVLVLPE